ncbi:cytochrome c-type biogenesis protein CcmE [Lentzea albidocapillata subsp. violacea]|uniref:Cytochrome c-type biogenesis protein CcmE n=1 Tax=Lentzea albidocapillata subsp. violacea TaxID=128104 RepID=A0A1G9ZAS0_9PSEU|nr:cytochrome c maturation protein CcmE [Lentzea albidocapillata]SDN17921.1 cytochrome c-type biogenesis protein CcmE [Lentzea albidocapillata subsp. violacea]
MKRYRLLVLSVAGVVLVLVGLLFFGNLNRNLVYYLTPQEAAERRADFPDGRRFQLGGLVREGSVDRSSGGLRFVVSSALDATSPSVIVEHTGAPAQLFQAGIGVVIEGTWQGDRFVSDTMIVKHDENYRPPATEGAAP